MATYDLICEQCSHKFEVFVQGFLRDDDRACPECGSRDVRQRFSSFLRNIGAARPDADCARPGGSPFG